MYAIVKIGGHQYKVSESSKIFVNRLLGEEGDILNLSSVFLIDNDNDNVQIGTPTVEGASVSVKILKHLKADKVIVFKKKRRKGYKLKRGHRQPLTQVEIQTIKF